MSAFGATTYNYRHFRLSHLVADAIGTWKLWGPAPGEQAPLFTSTDVDGRAWSLDAHRGHPVVLHFGSYT